MPKIALFLEMLIVLHRAPCTAPGEAVGAEEAVTEVIFVNLMGEILRPVCKSAGSDGTDAIGTHIGILERIDIHG